ncbi:MAG TPA: hypothetical protein VN838_11800, partial [Bradyrhizobium sp.]|nr:hypothetical protein [Bradyrhizobium sp.]
SEPVNVAVQGHYRFRIGAGRLATPYKYGVPTARAGFSSAGWNSLVIETRGYSKTARHPLIIPARG